MDSLVEPEIDYTVPPWGAVGRNITLGLVTLGSNVVMHWLNTLKSNGMHAFRQHVMHREQGVSLFTVCNHTSTLDDPILLGALLPWPYFWAESKHRGTRWSLCAKEICFKNQIFRDVFLNGKTLPIDRAQGVQQPIMGVVASKAAQGDWVHIFPEAKLSYSGRLLRLKRGIGKLICDSYTESKKSPIVLPFYHSGMGRIMPRGGRIPRVGHTVHVTVGQPVNLEDLLPRCNCAQNSEQTWADIAQRISEALLSLEKTAPPNWDQTVQENHGKRPASGAEITE